MKDACSAYKKFFKGLADKPKFKSRKKSKPSFYNDNLKLKVKKNSVLIAQVGWVQTAEQVPMDHKYLNPKISFDGKYWYLSVGMEQEAVQEELTDETMGIAIGIKDLAVCSKGMIMKNINKTNRVRKLEKRLRRLQRSVFRKYIKNKEGNRFVKTSNTIKQEKQIRLLHRKLTNIRINHIHQATSKIVKTKPSTIVMEYLRYKSA